MTKIHAPPNTYKESEPGNPDRNPVPILAPGIGTRIAKVSALLGIRKNAYEVAHVSSATLQRYLAEETAPAFDAMARLCMAAGVSLEWLATGEGPMLAADAAQPAPCNASQLPGLDEAKLAEALATIDQALALAHRVAPPEAHARLTVLAYRVLVEEDSVSSALSRIMEAVGANTGE